MEQKLCLITGANSGIGKAAAIQIAQKGLKVLIGCRNIERGNDAVAEIRKRSNNPEVYLLLIDLSSQVSITKAAAEINAKYEKLDILIHNAADFDISRKMPFLSDDGIETVWATNHIGPVLLTQLLLDRLKESEQGRIITVSSQGLMLHPLLKVNLEDPEFAKESFSVAKAYYQSKLAQVMYTYWLAAELKGAGITVNCIRVTNVKVDIQRYPNISKWMKFIYSIKSKFSVTPEEMAKIYTYLATSKELTSVTGKYFDEKGNQVLSSSYSRSQSDIDSLMKVTMKYIQ